MRELVSIVIPFYNPENEWEKKFMENMEKIDQSISRQYEIEIILVDDGSKHDLNEAFDRISKNWKTSRTKNQVNAGKGNAVRKGVSLANGKYIIYTDSDIPYENKHIAEHLELLEKGDDIVITVRDKTYYDTIPLQRKIISQIVQYLIKFLFRLPTADTQGGLKSMNKKGKEILINTKIDGYLFDLEFIKEAFKQKRRIGYIHGELKQDIIVKKVDLSVLFKEFYNLLYLLK